MTFREKLVILRKIKGITQEEFACAVGVSRQAVYKWESGQSYPEVPKLLEMKLLFSIRIDDLLDDSFDIELPKKKRKKRTPKVQPEAAAPAVEAPKTEEAAPVAEAPKAKKAPKAKAAPAPEVAPVVEAPKAEAPKAEPKAEPKKAAKKPAAPKAAPKTDIKDDLKFKSELLRKLFAKK